MTDRTRHGDPMLLDSSDIHDGEYGNAVVVTVTFKGATRFERSSALEKAAKRIGHNGIFSEQVEVDSKRWHD